VKPKAARLVWVSGGERSSLGIFALLSCLRHTLVAGFLGSLRGQGQPIQSLESDQLVSAGPDAAFDFTWWWK
jgi:hypothetical protein